MKLKFVKIEGAKNADKTDQEAELLKEYVIERCLRTIAEAQAIASVADYEEKDVLKLLGRTLIKYANKYAKRSREDE